MLKIIKVETAVLTGQNNYKKLSN